MITGLDDTLTAALSAMAEADWVTAERTLSTNLAESQTEHRRLQLFLLSIAKASTGQSDSANSLWAQAQKTEFAANPVRYFDLQLSPNDPKHKVLIDLEQAWWNFNAWNQAATTTTQQLEGIDWEWLLDQVLDGRDELLESKYGSRVEHAQGEDAFLWNFFALAYMQAGKLRTYQEMYQSRPPTPEILPSNLEQALAKRRFEQAIQVLKGRDWLTLDTLAENPIEFASEAPNEAKDWDRGMKDGFCFLDLGQYQKASRHFQAQFSVAGTKEERMLCLNALSLSFFRLGDYTQSEQIFLEFQSMWEPSAATIPQLQSYRQWLMSVDVEPTEEGFFSPFGGQSDWNTDQQEAVQIDFLEQFSKCLTVLKDKPSDARREILLLENQTLPGSSDRYFVTLLYLVSSVISGDHFAVQEFETELNALRAQTQFDEQRLQEVCDSLKWCGFETLAARMTEAEGQPSPINPWQDIG